MGRMEDHLGHFYSSPEGRDSGPDGEEKIDMKFAKGVEYVEVIVDWMYELKAQICNITQVSGFSD